MLNKILKFLAAVVVAFWFIFTTFDMARADDFDYWRDNLPLWRDVTAVQISALIESGANVAAEDEDGWTPLFYLAQDNTNPAVLSALIDGGADVLANVDGWTPLHAAAVHNINPAVITELIDGGADVLAADIDGRTPLHEAAVVNTNPAVLSALIDGGADVMAKDEIYGGTPLHWAAAHNAKSAVISALVAGGADVMAKDETGGWTPLHWAAKNNLDSDFIDVLVVHGAEINYEDDAGVMPIHRAIQNKRFKRIITALVAHGANIDSRDKDGDKPLDWARGRLKDEISPGVVEYLLNPDRVAADVRAYKRSYNNKYPLHAAARDGNSKRVRKLLESTKNVGQPDHIGKTALYYAKKSGHENIVEIINLHGPIDPEPDKCSLNNLSYRKKYPLHVAARKGDANEVERLLMRNSKLDKDDKDPCGNKILDYAKTANNHAVIRILCPFPSLCWATQPEVYPNIIIFCGLGGMGILASFSHRVRKALVEIIAKLNLKKSRSRTASHCFSSKDGET